MESFFQFLLFVASSSSSSPLYTIRPLSWLREGVWLDGIYGVLVGRRSKIEQHALLRYNSKSRQIVQTPSEKKKEQLHVVIRQSRVRCEMWNVRCQDVLRVAANQTFNYHSTRAVGSIVLSTHYLRTTTTQVIMMLLAVTVLQVEFIIQPLILFGTSSETPFWLSRHNPVDTQPPLRCHGHTKKT